MKSRAKVEEKRAELQQRLEKSALCIACVNDVLSDTRLLINDSDLHLEPPHITRLKRLESQIISVMAIQRKQRAGIIELIELLNPLLEADSHEECLRIAAQAEGLSQLNGILQEAIDTGMASITTTAQTLRGRQ